MDSSDIRKGLKIVENGQPWTVTYFQFVKPGKGTAFTRTKIKNLITGAVVDRTYRSGEKLEPADVETIEMQYLYSDGELWHFMNMESFDQIGITAKPLGDSVRFLLEEMILDVLFYNGDPVNIELPNFVEMIIECDPGVRGNTAQGGNKPATLPTGFQVNVPLFLDSGTTIKIDTRTGAYCERVRK